MFAPGGLSSAATDHRFSSACPERSRGAVSEGGHMRRSFSRANLVALVWAGAVSPLPAQQPAPDVILSNGKIITVDERFTVAQAIAVRGDRIVTVGSAAEV